MELINTRYCFILGFLTFLSFPVLGQITEAGQQAYFTFDGDITDRKFHLASQYKHTPEFGRSRIGADPGAVLLNGKQLSIRDTASVIDFSGKRNFTISFWLRIGNKPKRTISLVSNLPQISQKEPFLRLEADTNGIATMRLKYGRKKSESLIIPGSRKIADNKWHHVVLVTDINDTSRNLKVYIDNHEEISSEFKGAGLYPIPDLYFGEEIQEGGTMLLLDDLRCYSNKIYPVDIGQLYYEGLSVNYNMVFLKNTNLPDNSSTIMTGLDANREKVLFNISKYRYLKGYSIRIIDLKRVERCYFSVESDKYEFELEKWGGPGQYFMEIIDEENNLYQVFKIQFRNNN